MSKREELLELSQIERPPKRFYMVEEEDGPELIWGNGEEMADNVNNPSHYNQAGIECIDAMQAMTEGVVLNPHEAYCWQNAFKYLWRWPYKNGIEDLKKARWYLDRLVELEEKNE